MRSVLWISLLIACVGCTSPKKAIQPSSLLVEKAPTAPAMLRKVVKEGYVAVTILFKVSFDWTQLGANEVAINAARKEVKELQDQIVTDHFGKARTPREGRGFARDLERFTVKPGFTVHVDAVELEKLAADERITEIREN